MKLILEECRDESRRNELEALIETGAIDQIIKAWVNNHRNLRLNSGTDDENLSKRVYIVFEDKSFGEDEIGAAYCSMQDVLGSRPIVQELIPPPLLKTLMNPEENQADEIFFEKRAKLLNEDYDYEVYSCVFSLQAAVDGALGLALSENGETNFSKFPVGLLEEMEEGAKEVYENNFLAVDSYRSDKKGVYSEVLSSYVDLRKEEVMVDNQFSAPG